MNSYSKRLLFLIVCFFLPRLVLAQASVQTSIPEPNFLYQCADSSMFTVTLKNTTALPITGISFNITQPTGIVKVGSSTAEKGIISIPVTDPPANDNSNVLIFTVGTTLAVGDSIVLKYWAKALCNTANLVYTNTVNVTYTGGATQVNTLSYTTQVPFIELENPSTPTTDIACANDTFTQVVQVKNNGNFNSLIPFVDIEIVHSASISITSTSIGTIMTVDGKTVVRLSGNDFNSVGNADNVLDFDESISITVTGKLLDCISADQTVTFQPLYRCKRGDIAVCRRVPEMIVHTLNVVTPDTPPVFTRLTSCALNSPTSSLQITNTSASISKFIRVNLSIPAGCNCQAIDISSLIGSINGGASFPLTITTSTPTTSACLTSNTNNKQALTLTLPDLNPADVITLNWNATLCGDAVCNNASISWQYEILYQSSCCPNTLVNIGSGSCTIQPTLSATVTSACTNGTKSLVITNTGNKAATDVAIRLFTAAAHLSGITAGSITNSSGTLTFVGSTLANVCLNPTMLRETNYTLSSIPAGGSVTITWDITSCQNFTACTSYNSEDYGYEVSYAQSCATGTVTLNGSVSTPERVAITDTDNDLVRTRTCPTENTYTLPLSISGVSLTYTARYAEVVIDLPANFTWNGVAADLLLNGVTAPVSTTITGNTMTIRYALPIAGLPATIAPTFNINCATVCNGIQNIDYTINAYNNCEGNNALLHTCNGTQFIDVDTPNPSCAFPPNVGCVTPTIPTQTVRTNFGQDDANNDRHADGSTTGQASRLNKLLMYTDTLQTTYRGRVASTPNADTLIVNIVLYQRQSTNYNYLTLFDLDLSIKDTSTNITYTLNNIQNCASIASIRDTLSSRIYTLAITEAAINACYPSLLPANFAFDVNDMISYQMKHRVSSNLGLNVTRTLQIRTDMYLINSPTLWQNPLPIFPGCPEAPADSVQVVGYQYQVTSNQTNADICRGTIDVNITHDFNIQTTGNLNVFPFEDRRWVKFNTITLTIPTGFTCNPATSVWTYTTPPAVLNVPVPPSTQVGNVITFDLTNYYTANNISVDDGTKLNIKLTLSTLCNAQASNTLIANYAYDSSLPLISNLPTQATFNINTNVPIINYSVNSSPTSCTGTKATWTFSVTNSNASSIDITSAYYNWLHIEIPPASGFSNVVLLEGVTPITPNVNSGFYLLGDIPKNTTKTYTLTVDYANSAGAACYNNSLKLFYDWSCENLNTTAITTANFKTQYTCSYDSTQLSFEAGANTVLIDVLNSSYNKVNVCENNVYKARVRNIGQNNLRNVKVNITPPTGFSFVANTFTYSYSPAVDVPFTNNTVIIPNFATSTFFDVSFQYTTTCLDNLAGNAQFIINIDVETCCAGDTLAAYPLPALDVSQIDKGEHKFNIGLSHTPDFTCVIKNTTLTINLTNTGGEASGKTDRVVITLPSGLKYAPNTITTNVGGIGDSSLTTVGNQINWKIDPTNINPVAINGTRQFTLQLQDTTTAVSCNNYNIIVQTFQQGIAACDALSPSLSCTRWRFTGSRNRRIRILTTNFSILNTQLTSLSPVDVNITFRNNGPNIVPAGTTYLAKVYFNNLYDNTLSITVPTQINIGSTYTYAYTNIPCPSCFVRIELEQVAPNCICSPSSDEVWTGVPLFTPITINAYLDKQNDGIIYWKSNNNNVAYFELQRSQDTESFTTIARIEAKDNKIDYYHIDNMLQEGKYHYRLRIITLQNQIIYSNIAEIDRLPALTATVLAYPNPFSKQITLTFSRKLVGELDISLYTTAGKLVWETQEDINNQTINITPTNLPKGIYILHIKHQNQLWAIKVIKE